MRVVRVAVVAAVLGLLGLLVWDVAHGSGPGVAQKVDQGRKVPAPKLDLPRLDADGRLSLASLRGKVVVVNFWESYCVPCKQEARRVADTARAWKDKGVVFVGVNAFDTKRAGAGVPRPLRRRLPEHPRRRRHDVRQLGRDRRPGDVLHRPARPCGAAAHHGPGFDEGARSGHPARAQVVRLVAVARARACPRGSRGRLHDSTRARGDSRRCSSARRATRRSTSRTPRSRAR